MSSDVLSNTHVPSNMHTHCFSYFIAKSVTKTKCVCVCVSVFLRVHLTLIIEQHAAAVSVLGNCRQHLCVGLLLLPCV